MAEQDKILGYFLDEAQEHLKTIEAGLASPITLAQSACIKEVFRAAHSLKGGAAMLDIPVVQQIGHHLEQAFKQIKDHSIPLDSELQSSLQEALKLMTSSIKQLQAQQSPDPQLAQQPVFDKIQKRLLAIDSLTERRSQRAKNAHQDDDSDYLYADPAIEQVFGSYVTQKLQQFREICQKPQADVATKQELQQICQKVGSLGESFEFLAWTNLLISCRLAISNPLNSIIELQEVVPKAVQQAQMLVIAGKQHAITSTPELEILLTPNAINITRTPTVLEGKEINPFELEDGLWDDSIADGDPFGDSSFTTSNTQSTSDFLFEPQMVGTEDPPTNGDLAQFMELFDEDLPADGTWVQEDNIFLDPLATNPPAVAASESDALWEEDIFARPLSGNLSGSLNHADFAGVVNPPPFDFESADSDLFVEDLPITAVDPIATPPAVAPVTATLAAAAVAPGQPSYGIDWSGLLADIPNEVVMEYDEPSLAQPLDESITPPPENLPEIASELKPADAAADFWFSETAAALSHPVADLEDPFALNGSPPASSGTFDVAAPIFTDFVPETRPEVSLPDSDFHHQSLPSNSWDLSDILATNGNYAGMTAANSLMDFDLDDIFHPESPPELPPEAPPDKIPLEADPPELVSASRNGSGMASPPIEIDADYLQELSFFDDLLADTKITDVNLDDLEQIVLNGNLESELELETLENLKDFSPASVSTNPLAAPGNLTEATRPHPTTVEELGNIYRPVSGPPESAMNLDELDLLDLSALGDLTSLDEELNATELDAVLEGLDLMDMSDLEDSVADQRPTADEAMEALDFLSDPSSATAVDLDAELANFSFAANVDLADDFANMVGDINLDSDFASMAGDIDLDSDFAGMTGDINLDSDFASMAGDIDLDSDFASMAGDIDLDSNFASMAGDINLDNDFANMVEASNEIDFARELGDLEMPASELADLDNLDFGDEQNFADLPEPAVNLQDLDSLFADDNSSNFDDLDSLLTAPTVIAAVAPVVASVPAQDDDEFNQLEKMLQRNDSTKIDRSIAAPKARVSRQRTFEQTMRVSVKNLNNLNNLTGELVVNRNTLEQDQNRMRQFLDKLLLEVQKLNEVGRSMQDIYERSLLETSLVAGRQAQQAKSAPAQPKEDIDAEGTMSEIEYDPLEMDRFTPIHLISQQMIELTVRIRESTSDIEFVVDSSGEVTRILRQITSQLQEDLNKSRMLPFAQTADRLQRGVRDNGLKYGKEVELEVEGRETPIDKVILESLNDPLVHMVNNAIAHGIETPETRIAAGKPAQGTIKIRAIHQGTQTIISIEDDGAGIDTDIVKRKAIEKGIITATKAAEMSKQEVYDILFLPSFSTRDKADELAGRGVGMDVVMSSLQEIRGTITTESKLGKGTTFTIRLPLALSITKALMALNAETSIAFPMDGIEDSQDIHPDDVVENEAGQKFFHWRGELMPFRPLSDLLSYNRPIKRINYYGGLHQDEEEKVSIIVLRSSGELVAVEIERVIGEQEIVIKPLQGPAPKPVGIAGATVLGDGRIIPIADVMELVELAKGTIGRQNTGLWSIDPIEEQPAQREPMVLVVDDSITVRQLLSLTFTKAGYRVEQARDGQEAWDKLRAGLPCDIIFCDIEMPRMDGLELLSKVQQDEALKKIPMAMLTSRGSDRHRQIASQLGASGYFIKPYLEDALLEAVKRMIKGEVLAIV
jgi:chemotaxis protein histidine kinase CheA/ActR/RegA family two-component response regulator